MNKKCMKIKDDDAETRVVSGTPCVVILCVICIRHRVLEYRLGIHDYRIGFEWPDMGGVDTAYAKVFSCVVNAAQQGAMLFFSPDNIDRSERPAKRPLPICGFLFDLAHHHGHCVQITKAVVGRRYMRRHSHDGWDGIIARHRISLPHVPASDYWERHRHCRSYSHVAGVVYDLALVLFSQSRCPAIWYSFSFISLVV
jgi:hypothetical protein